LRKQIELVGFLDQGYGRLHGPSPSEARTRYLLGEGGGLRIQLYKHLYARAELAFELGNEPLNESNRRAFHFRLQAEQ
jgi:hemolysin activation/secretion protein